MERMNNCEFYLGDMHPKLLMAWRLLSAGLRKEYMDGLYRTEDAGNGLLKIIAVASQSDEDAVQLDIMFRAFRAGVEAAQDLEPKR